MYACIFYNVYQTKRQNEHCTVYSVIGDHDIIRILLLGHSLAGMIYTFELVFYIQLHWSLQKPFKIANFLSTQ